MYVCTYVRTIYNVLILGFRTHFLWILIEVIIVLDSIHTTYIAAWDWFVWKAIVNYEKLFDLLNVCHLIRVTLWLDLSNNFSLAYQIVIVIWKWIETKKKKNYDNKWKERHLRSVFYSMFIPTDWIILRRERKFKIKKK